MCKRTNRSIYQWIYTPFLLLLLLFLFRLHSPTHQFIWKNMFYCQKHLTEHKHTTCFIKISKCHQKFIQDFRFFFIEICTQERTTSNNSISNMANLNLLQNCCLFPLNLQSLIKEIQLFTHALNSPWMKSVQVTYFTKYENTIKSYFSNHLPDFFFLTTEFLANSLYFKPKKTKLREKNA